MSVTSANAPFPSPAGAPAAPAQPPVSRKVVAAAVAGNAIEFYDFVTYAYFAVYIGQAFFPAKTPFMSLLLSVAVFGVGFISRPLGGILIGAYADRAGRKPAMLLTIALITVGTMGLALTPSYESIGIAAPIIVVLARLVQGLALGGEVGPSTSFLIEIAPPGKRGLYASWQLASQGLAAMVAGAVGMIMAAMLTTQQLHDWGWRVPFAVGLLLIPVALFLRKQMPETVEHGPHVDPTAPRESAGTLLRRHSWILFLGTLIILGGTVSTYVGTYMTTYAIATLKMAPTVALAATTMFGLSTFVCSLLGGWLSDHYGRKIVMVIPRIALALLTYPAFLLLTHQPNLSTLLLATALVGGMTGISGAAGMAVVPELLPLRVRALGFAVVYAVGVSLFGGTTQLIVTWLIGVTGSPLAPAWYVAATSVVCVIAMLLIPESSKRELAR